MRRIPLVSVIAVAAAVALTGCSAATTPRPTVTRTVTASPTPTASASAASPRPSDTSGAPAGQCADQDLVISIALAAGGGAAGHTEYDVAFENVGTAACALEGYPGVSLVDAQKRQIGAAATFTGSAPVLRTLQPKGSVFVPVLVADSGAIPGCDPVQAEGWSVYAPHSTLRSVNLNGGTIPACSSGVDFLQVTAPVAPGTHG